MSGSKERWTKLRAVVAAIVLVGATVAGSAAPLQAQAPDETADLWLSIQNKTEFGERVLGVRAQSSSDIESYHLQVAVVGGGRECDFVNSNSLWAEDGVWRDIDSICFDSPPSLGSISLVRATWLRGWREVSARCFKSSSSTDRVHVYGCRW